MGDNNNNNSNMHKVWAINELKRKPEKEKAKKVLEKIAKQVQPIMTNHKWRVKALSEFCPSNPSLLGTNYGAGVHVRLRLRKHNRDLDFIPYEQVLDTMLHELCHNAHGPHNASFYKLWDELRKECEDLINKGISGSGVGFDLPGRRLGGFSRQPTVSSFRKTALAAAENRARLGSLLPSGPKRLGGDSSIMGALSPIQAAAMAAERRLQDDIWCGSQQSDVFEEEESDSNLASSKDSFSKSTSKKPNIVDLGENYSNLTSGKDSFTKITIEKPNVVDLTAPSVSGLSHNPLSRKRSRETYGTSFSRPGDDGYPKSGFVDLTTVASTSSSSPNNGNVESTQWECKTCTLLNPPLAPICELCSSQKPKEVENKYKLWSCKFCTLENSLKLDKCTACDQWRYSHGAPLSTTAPNAGT